MSEKKAKERRQEESMQPKVVNTIEFRMMSNGQVIVAGPITDPVLLLDVVGKGLVTLAVYHAQKSQSRIITPDSGLTMARQS